MDQKDLLELLTYRRPYKGTGESAVIARYLDVLPGIVTDPFGNRILVIGESSTVFSAHTDTVHELDGRQKIRAAKSVVTLRDQKPCHDAQHRKVRDCLGADDGAGMYVLLRLIQARKPGVYIFHRAEECGGLGSEFLADRHLLRDLRIDRAIAFDRRGYTEIITHQMMRRCCSNEFAWTLADELGMNHTPCNLGTFTDTANYVEDVPECTNVSVGYHYEHTSREWLDLDYLEQLIAAAIKVDFESLPVVRDNTRHEYEDSCYHSECRHLDSCLYRPEKDFRGLSTCGHKECDFSDVCIYSLDR
jgi:hypothetical protein